jgi:EpsI family protein
MSERRNLSPKYQWLTLLLLAGTLAVVWGYHPGGRGAYAVSLRTIPESLDDWIAGPIKALEPQVERKLAATEYLNRVYARPGQAADVFIAYYACQRAGEMMHSPKNCLPGAGWEIWKTETVQLPVQNQNVSINRYSVEKSLDRRVVLYWYQTRKRILASEYMAKLFLAWDGIKDGDRAGALVRVTVLDENSAVAGGLRFAARLIAALQASLGDAREPLAGRNR